MGKFEDNWKGVFEEAESVPSDSVWNNIDRDLEGVVMKKRVVFYQRIAAAAMLFALLIGGYEVYHWKSNERTIDELGQSKSTNELKKIERKTQPNSVDQQITYQKKNEIPSVNKNSELARVSTEKKQTSDVKKISSKEISNTQNLMANEMKTDIVAFSNENKRKESDYFEDDRSFYSSIDKSTTLALLPGAKVEGQPVIKELVRTLPAIPGAFMADTRRDKSSNENLWASLTASSGSYNPNTANSTAYALSSSSGSQIGTSYSMAMLAGALVAKRWTMQSGVQYLNQSVNASTYASSSYSLSTIASTIYATPGSYSSGNGATPTSIVSANEFISVPVQAGYLIIDKKMGWQINSGVATDFFIRNTLSDPSGQRQSYSQSAGQDSPYRPVNFSGLLSSEVSYKLTGHYRISLVPGFRYSFNPVLKSSLSTTSGNPWMWDVGFRLKYIFK